MEIKEIAKWDESETSELYFDKVFQHYIIKKGSLILIKPLDQAFSLQVSLDKQSEEICNQKFIRLRILFQKSLLCCLTQENRLLLFRYKDFKKFKTNTSKDKILGFQFLSNHEVECFFFVVTENKVSLYKMNFKTYSFKIIKIFNVQAVEYSFEEKEGILAVLSPQGQVCIFYLHQQKKSRAYLGPVFDLDLEKNVALNVTCGPKSMNLLAYVPRVDCNQVFVFKIYDECFLIHLDNLSGKLFLYKLQQNEQPFLYTIFPIHQGIFGLGISEHLIILQSYTIQETFIYDIHSQITDYVIKISHLEYEQTQTVKSRVSAEFSMRTHLNCDTYFVSDAITIDTMSCSFKTLKINPSLLIENHPDDEKIILFLLRRDNCKSKVLAKLKESLLQYTSIKKLEIIFATLASAYALAKDENKNIKKMRALSDYFQHLELTTTDINPNDELKTETGVTVLMQSDIYFFVFDPVYKLISDIKYFTEALFSFVYFFNTAGLSVHFSIQYLLFKVLIKIEDYKRTQNLVENRFFTDSQDIALFLTSLGKTEISKKFPSCFTLGVDMLYRLNLYSVIAQELHDQDFDFEALEINESSPIPEKLLKSILKS